jgi:hypothetical protein
MVWAEGFGGGFGGFPVTAPAWIRPEELISSRDVGRVFRGRLAAAYSNAPPDLID